MEITNKSVWKEYESGLSFNTTIGLNETVQANENFFIGKQWEGVTANGLPTPTFNFIKRVVLFTVASNVSTILKLNASPLSDTENLSNILNKQFEQIFEYNNVSHMVRELMRNAAVDGDGCLYTYWNADIETGQAAKGGIVTEVIENTRVFFGNKNDRRVQKQPYIIISTREMINAVQERMSGDKDAVRADNDERNINTEYQTDDKVTVLLKLWRNKKTGTIWGFECTKDAVVREAWDLGLTLYPITWLNWDYVQDCYHGQSMVTGLIPNQIFINKMYAMSMMSLMTTAYPKVVYDKTRVKSWSNQIGAAIGVNGGDVNSVARIIDPAQISPQIAQFIQMAMEDTQSTMGATSVALGDTRPDNTSAIVALQKAAATPHELTKGNLYACLEELGRIYIDFMREYYGVRMVESPIPQEAQGAAQFAGVDKNPMISYDFDSLKGKYMTVKLDVGASAYWSEIANMQTLDNLLMQGKIDIVDYLERVPNGYIIKQQELIDKAKGQQAQMAAMQRAMQDAPPNTAEQEPNTDEIPLGAGNSAFHRAIVSGA